MKKQTLNGNYVCVCVCVVCICVLCASGCHTFAPWLTCDCGEKAHFKQFIVLCCESKLALAGILLTEQSMPSRICHLVKRHHNSLNRYWNSQEEEGEWG